MAFISLTIFIIEYLPYIEECVVVGFIIEWVTRPHEAPLEECFLQWFQMNLLRIVVCFMLS